MVSDTVQRVAAAVIGALCAAAVLVGLTPASGTMTLSAVQTEAEPSDGDVGFRGASYAGVSNPPTAEKPQSKLWFHDGTWWAVMFDPAVSGWRIYSLDRASQTWVPSGVRVDERRQTLSDVLWSGDKLYVASHWVTTSTDTVTRVSVAKQARLYRYSYDAAQRTWVLDAGFPSQITGMSSEALTIDQDSTGRLWATWTQVSGSATAGYDAQVFYGSSADGSRWTTPQSIPATGAAVAPDDISAVISFGRSSIGILWSNQRDDTTYWAVHRDGTPVDVWTASVAVRGTKLPDDHLNLKALLSDEQGRVWAAVKTSLNDASGASASSPQIELMLFKPGTGSWSRTTVATVADCHTRPVVVLDEENSRVRVFATAPVASGCAYSGAPGAIYEKSASMSDPVFSAGRGTPVMRSASSPYLNHVTGSKHPVTSRTGLVLLASDTNASQYWHADLQVAATAAPTPTGEPSPTATAEPTSEPSPTVTAEPTSEPSPTVTAEPSSEPSPTATAPASAAPITRAGVSTATVTTAAAFVQVEKPAEVTEGDVLVSCLSLNGGRVASSGAPPGWEVLSTGRGISNPQVYGYYKVAGPQEPEAYRWSFASAVTSSAGIARYVGAAGLDSQVSAATGAAAGSATVPEVTTTTHGAMLVGCMGINSGAMSIAMDPSVSMGEAWDLGGKRQSYADELLGSVGGTGPRTWHFSASREWSGWLVALRPRG